MWTKKGGSIQGDPTGSSNLKFLTGQVMVGGPSPRHATFSTGLSLFLFAAPTLCSPDKIKPDA